MLAFSHLAEQSEKYRQFYLNLNAFEIVQADHAQLNSFKRLDTKLILPTVFFTFGIPHVICKRRPIIVRTDEPDGNEVYEDISIYLLNKWNLLILKKYDSEHNQLLMNSIRTNYFKIRGIQLSIPTLHISFIKEVYEMLRNADTIFKLSVHIYFLL